MATLSELQTRQETLRRMLHAGVLRWKIGDKETVYRSVDELQAALADIESQIVAADPTARKAVRQIRTYGVKAT